MKTTLLTIVLLCTILLSCAPSRPALPVDRQTVSFRYGFNAITDAYERPGPDSKRLGAFTKSDTVTTGRQLTSTQGWIAVDFRNRLVWVNNPNLYPIDAAVTEQRRASPPIVNRIFGHTLSNGFGLGIGGTSESALTIDGLYKYRRHMFRLGYTHQFNGQLGQNKGTQLANYGRTVVGGNTYFSAFGGGYDFWLNNRVAIGLDGYLGYNNGFTNYSDKRFSAGGYHMVTGSEGTSGYGGRVTYLPFSYFLVSGGYNTLTGVNLSLAFVSFGKVE